MDNDIKVRWEWRRWFVIAITIMLFSLLTYIILTLSKLPPTESLVMSLRDTSLALVASISGFGALYILGAGREYIALFKAIADGFEKGKGAIDG